MFDLPDPVDDGFEIPEVGSWSTDKHHFLKRYIDAFTTAMKKKRWSGLHYIDLFASAGIERVEGNDKLEWGSSLIAAQAPHAFDQLHLCELKRSKFEALEVRVCKTEQRIVPQLICADANVAVGEIAAALPPGSLSLAFLDPYGLHLDFRTLRTLSASGRKIDLIIFFPDHVDALRNWKDVYLKNPDSNLDRVLGTPIWREQFENSAPNKRAKLLSELYIEQIRTLSYNYFEEERISLPSGRFLYKLIFCSASDVGSKIWRGISKNKPGGQSTFGFGV